jgi:hypothetical protein
MTEPLALLLSVLVEAPVAHLLVARLGWGRPGRAALAAALGTVCSHPFAWSFSLTLADRLGYWPSVMVTEAAVVVFESLGYLVLVPLPPRRALLASLVANAASTAFGFLIYGLDLA